MRSLGSMSKSLIAASKKAFGSEYCSAAARPNFGASTPVDIAAAGFSLAAARYAATLGSLTSRDPAADAVAAL
ncbi:hypothetical protein D3C86_1737380 [compost metagenome]